MFSPESARQQHRTQRQAAHKMLFCHEIRNVWLTHGGLLRCETLTEMKCKTTNATLNDFHSLTHARNNKRATQTRPKRGFLLPMVIYWKKLFDKKRQAVIFLYRCMQTNGKRTGPFYFYDDCKMVPASWIFSVQ